MAVDMFIKIGDIKGESKDDAHKQEIDVLAKLMFGPHAYAFDRTPTATGRVCIRAYRHERYYVGSPLVAYGNGATWKAAFAAAMKMVEERHG